MKKKTKNFIRKIKFVLSGGLKASPGVWKSFQPVLARKLLLFVLK
jgi:hypothetical protein